MKSLNWKKNFFSYAAWLACLFLTGYGVWTLAQRWSAESGLSGAVVYGISGGVLLLAGLLNAFVWLFRKKRQDGQDSEKDTWVIRLLEGVLLLVILVMGMYLRWERIPFANGAVYFETASIKAGQGVPILTHGIEYLYILALHGVCFVLGNNLVFCTWFHIALQGLAGLLCLLGIRRLTGRFSAIAFAACYFLSPGMIEKAVTLSPEPLFLFFFGIGLLAAGGFLRKESGAPRGYFMTGMVIAFILYLDVSGLALLGILLTVFFVDREEPESFWNRPAVSLLTALAGFGIVLAGIFILDAAISESSMTKVAGAWGNLYLTAGNPSVNPLKLLLEMKWGLELLSLLFVFLALGVFSFFLKRNQERISAWILAGGILLCLEIFGMTVPTMNGTEIFLLCICALAGTALSNYGREVAVEKVGMRKWDPSLYGILEDDEENDSSEDAYYMADGEGTYNEEMMGGDIGMSETTDRENTMTEDGTPASKGGNIFTRMVEAQNRKKEAKRLEAEKVLSVLSSLSEVEGVSISPDHKPGEALVKGPGGEEVEATADPSQVSDGRRKGFWGQKAETQVNASHMSGKKQDSRRENEGMESTAEQGGESLDDGRKPLHNPLPVPKKKAATMLDYDYEVSDDDDYDYD